jgi:hypothetical protein
MVLLLTLTQLLLCEGKAAPATPSQELSKWNTIDRTVGINCNPNSKNITIDESDLITLLKECI